MNKTNRISHFLIVTLLLTAILLLVFLTSGISIVDADVTSDIVVEDLSTDEANITRYSNLESVNHQSKTLKLFNTFARQQDSADVILSKIGVNESDLGDIPKEELISAKSITVVNTLLSYDVNGNLLRSSANGYVTSEDFPDIINDAGHGGYMAGSIIIVQNPLKNIENLNKDGEVTSVEYAFDITCNMRWLTKPTTTSDDAFSFAAWDGSVYTDSSAGNTCVATCTKYSYGSPSSYSMDVSTAYQSGWPVFHFNLPTDVLGINGLGITYNNFNFQSTGTMYAKDDFNVIMAYFHKQVAVGDYSIGVGAGGFSVSASLSGIVRKYETSGVHVVIVR